MVAAAIQYHPDELPLHPVPPTSITMKQLRAAVPPHCFERNLLTSLKHLLIDLFMVTCMALAINNLDRFGTTYGIPQWLISYIVWPIYWWWQGAVLTGVWVLAHECGHQSFSPWKSVNDAFGLVLHSALLVPYHSWRITHGQHHKQTNLMTGDQVFVPATREEYNHTHGITVEKGLRKYRFALQEAIEETPAGDMFGLFQMLSMGWWAYLVSNIAGQDYGPGTNHYNPKAKMFGARDYWDIIVSDIGIITAFAIIGTCWYNFGLLAVMKYYWVPYMFVNMWLVLITYLQHSDPAIPHYTAKEFNFVRGALCSVDRDYGIYNILHHHIGDTHVAHHLFSQMPFYHAQEATEAIKKVLGEYYCSDNTGIFEALRRSWVHCKFVDDEDGDIMYYRNYKMESLSQKCQ